jgi:hypothetical protein
MSVELPRYESPMTVYTTVTRVVGYVVKYTKPTAVVTRDGVRQTYVVVTEVTYYVGERGAELSPEPESRYARRELRTVR